MFSGCTNLKNLDLSKWNVKTLKGVDTMLCYCQSLETTGVIDWEGVDLLIAFMGCDNLKKSMRV